ncbi:MAG: hypothetical protein ACC662_02520 [Planctomycetota bacterium]
MTPTALPPPLRLLPGLLLPGLLLLGLLLLGLLLLLQAAGGHGTKDEGAEEPPRLPAPGTFNAHVLAVLATYATDGAHGYHWPRRGAWLGFTRTLRYDGRVLGEGDPQGRCHCSGLTFEVFFRAWERWCRSVGRPFRIADLDFEGVRRLQQQWFGTSGDRATLATALVGNGLGVRIERREDARPGDFVQLWRHSGSGHSCVFLGWVREGARVVGLRYWSTQSSTNGIGAREERFGASGSTVKEDEFYVVRVGSPPSDVGAPPADDD